MFRNYDDTVLTVLKSHVERLVSDTSHDTHETSQRCAAEMIAALIRGSKHWHYDKVMTSLTGTGQPYTVPTPPGKSWKVLDFFLENSRTWKVL